VTARDLQKLHRQWFLGKSLNTFCPMGPWIGTADAIDPANTGIQCWVNDELRQDANTSDLIFDIPMLTAGFGLLGYLFNKLGCEEAPRLLGFVLGPMMEENFRRSLLLSRGDFSVFFTRPLSLSLLIATVVLIIIVALPSIKSKREEAFQEE
jgi:hypothetical protein